MLLSWCNSVALSSVTVSMHNRDRPPWDRIIERPVPLSVQHGSHDYICYLHEHLYSSQTVDTPLHILTYNYYSMDPSHSVTHQSYLHCCVVHSFVLPLTMTGWLVKSDDR